MLKKICFFIIAPLILTSCLNFHSTISVNEDLTGSLNVLYTGSAYVWEIKSFEEEQVLCQLPQNLNQLTSQVSNFLGLTLAGGTFDWGPRGLTANFTINFENPDQLTPLLSFWGGEGVVNFSNDTDGFVWNHLLYSPIVFDDESDSQAMIARNYPEYTIKISIQTSGSLIESDGVLEADGKTVTFKYPIESLFTSEGVQGQVRWRR